MQRLALLTPELPTVGKNLARLAEPFGMPAKAALPEDIASKWSDLQSRILADEKTIAACRLNEASCSPAARRFLSLAETGGKNERRVQLGMVNRAVNLAIRPESDWAQYGYADFWASPLQTLASGAGDCEDYAIVKYVVLRALGMAEADLRLMIVHDDKHQTEHAIVVVRDEQEWLILDNRTMFIVNADDASYYNPHVRARTENATDFRGRHRRHCHRSIIWPSRATIVPARTSLASAAIVSMKSSSCDGS